MQNTPVNFQLLHPLCSASICFARLRPSLTVNVVVKRTLAPPSISPACSTLMHSFCVFVMQTELIHDVTKSRGHAEVQPLHFAMFVEIEQLLFFINYCLSFVWRIRYSPMGGEDEVEERCCLAKLQQTSVDLQWHCRGLREVLWQVLHVLGQQGWTHGEELTFIRCFHGQN